MGQRATAAEDGQQHPSRSPASAWARAGVGVAVLGLIFHTLAVWFLHGLACSLNDSGQPCAANGYWVRQDNPMFQPEALWISACIIAGGLLCGLSRHSPGPVAAGWFLMLGVAPVLIWTAWSA